MKLSLKIKTLSFFVFLLLMAGCSENTMQETQVDDEVSEDPPTEPIATTQLSDGLEVPTDALVALGEKLYNDTNLSEPVGQACASCHSPTTGFDDPDDSNPTSRGADGISFGARNAPTASYAAHIPEPQTVLVSPPGGGADMEVLIGGLFLDGRAESLEEQAKGPFLNPIEMGNADESAVLEKIKVAAYASEFESLFGTGILDETDRAYNYLADAIAAFERTDLFNPFNSKFDRVQQGLEAFTDSESRGENLFNGRAQCDRCHSTNDGSKQVFSNFEFHNIGVPSNPLLPDVMSDPTFVDRGLGAVTGNPRDDGKFRTSSLRNIAITGPYMHNGVFSTLTEVVEFYNTRDTTFGQAPEVDRNVDQGGDIGELGLSPQDVQDLVAFLNTLTDD